LFKYSGLAFENHTGQFPAKTALLYPKTILHLLNWNTPQSLIRTN